MNQDKPNQICYISRFFPGINRSVHNIVHRYTTGVISTSY